jgi:predicted GIY-YIG superfamily endonuclease
VTDIPAETTPVAVEILAAPTAVYRFYNRDDRLLYVGISGNLTARWKSHAASKPWWRRVTRKTVVMYGSRGEALNEESRAILAEYPVHNIVRDTIPGRKEKRAPKPPGRPAASSTPLGPPRESFLFGPDILLHVDSYARERDLSRSEAVIELIGDGLVRAGRADIAAMEADMQKSA